jgi:toxin YoeB
MEIVYTDKALKDVSYWRKIGDKITQQKITNLICSIEKTPFERIGKTRSFEISSFREMVKENR